MFSDPSCYPDTPSKPDRFHLLAFAPYCNLKKKFPGFIVDQEKTPRIRVE